MYQKLHTRIFLNDYRFGLTILLLYCLFPQAQSVTQIFSLNPLNIFTDLSSVYSSHNCIPPYLPSNVSQRNVNFCTADKPNMVINQITVWAASETTQEIYFNLTAFTLTNNTREDIKPLFINSTTFFTYSKAIYVKSSNLFIEGKCWNPLNLSQCCVIHMNITWSCEDPYIIRYCSLPPPCISSPQTPRPPVIEEESSTIMTILLYLFIIGLPIDIILNIVYLYMKYVYFKKEKQYIDQQYEKPQELSNKEPQENRPKIVFMKRYVGHGGVPSDDKHGIITSNTPELSNDQLSEQISSIYKYHQQQQLLCNEIHPPSNVVLNNSV
jgi:hypothetical protein